MNFHPDKQLFQGIEPLTPIINIFQPITTLTPSCEAVLQLVLRIYVKHENLWYIHFASKTITSLYYAIVLLHSNHLLTTEKGYRCAIQFCTNHSFDNNDYELL